MIFKHEFEITPDQSNVEKFLEFNKARGAADLGIKIMEYYPYTPVPVPFANENYKMEIIVYSWEQWKEFRDKLNYTVSLTRDIRLLQAIRAIIEAMEQGIPDGKDNTERV